MPTQTEVRGENLVMWLISRQLGDAGPLARFIAVRRLPGEDWQTWQQVAFSLHQHIGRVLTAASVRNWARRYGIPLETSPKDSADLVQLYRDQVKAAGIDI